MKWNTEKSTAKIAPTRKSTLDDIISERIGLYEWMGWVSEVTDDDIKLIIKSAKETEQRIIAAGLNPKPYDVYRIGIIPACFAALHPHVMRTLLRDLLDRTGYSDWGYVNTEHYGEQDEPKGAPHGFTESDIGKVFFLVEDANAPGHSPEMPGSLLAGYYWGEERDRAWMEWKQKFTKAGTIKALNCAIHGLILLGEITDWGKALGRVGVYDYIEQPYDVSRDLCPCGGVSDDGEVEWDAFIGGAETDFAAAAVVW